jgi:hypothetical protein
MPIPHARREEGRRGVSSLGRHFLVDDIPVLLVCSCVFLVPRRLAGSNPRPVVGKKWWWEVICLFVVAGTGTNNIGFRTSDVDAPHRLKNREDFFFWKGV